MRRRRLSQERTPCPHCGRDTQTTSDGVCAECWGQKVGRSRLWPPYRKPRTEPLLGEGDDEALRWLPGCLSWVVLAVAAGIAVRRR